MRRPVLRTMLRSTVHRATVTVAAEPPPAGAVLVDEDVLDAAELLAGELVTVVDGTGGAGGPRREAHAVAAPRGSGVLVVAGTEPGRRVTLLCFAQLDGAEARHHRARTVFVDGRNRVVEHDPAGVPTADQPAAAEVAEAETDDAARLDALLNPEA